MDVFASSQVHALLDVALRPNILTLRGVCEKELQIHRLIPGQTRVVEVHRFAARTERHFQRLFAVIRSYLDALDSSRFAYRPGPNCEGCEYCFSHCQRWKT